MTTTAEFIPFSKIPRLSRECFITEKIDGTNGQIYIGENGELGVGSRYRWITPEADNFGFAAWAYANKEELLLLGPGRHFGEWWGRGIQRGYGLVERKFSLFNTGRWCKQNPQEGQQICPPCCDVVPVLYRGQFSTEVVGAMMERLRALGSYAAPGFFKPEGVIVYHVSSGEYFKKTIEKDEVPKGAK